MKIAFFALDEHEIHAVGILAAYTLRDKFRVFQHHRSRCINSVRMLIRCIAYRLRGAKQFQHKVEVVNVNVRQRAPRELSAEHIWRFAV
ncbi:hypothetical protein D3C77_311710 [compost metagenome]